MTSTRTARRLVTAVAVMSAAAAAFSVAAPARADEVPTYRVEIVGQRAPVVTHRVEVIGHRAPVTTHRVEVVARRMSPAQKLAWDRGEAAVRVASQPAARPAAQAQVQAVPLARVEVIGRRLQDPFVPVADAVRVAAAVTGLR